MGAEPNGRPKAVDSFHRKAKVPSCSCSSDPMNLPFMNRVSVWKLKVPVAPVLGRRPIFPPRLLSWNISAFVRRTERPDKMVSQNRSPFVEHEPGRHIERLGYIQEG